MCLFGHLLPGATGTPPLKTRDHIKRMITIMERDTPMSKDRWIGHPSIPLRMFSLKQYLVTPPVQRTKPRMTSRPLLASTLTSKLVLKESQSDFKDHRKVKLTCGGDAKGLVKAEAGVISYFIHWFQTISANLDTEVQKRALSASREAASSVLTDEWYDEGRSNVVKVAPI